MSNGGAEYLAVDFKLPARLDQLASLPERLVPLFDALTLDTQTQYNITLAVHELLVNIIEHAYADKRGRIRLRAYVDPANKRLRIETRDRGKSFNPQQVARPELGTLQENGFGLFLIEQLMDEVSYRTARSGNYWTLAKQLNG